MTPLQQSILAGIAVLALYAILAACIWFSRDRHTRDAQRRIDRSRARSREIIDRGFEP